MSHATDERMIVLRDMVEDLIERQRISRFDTVFFLIYPVLLAAVTALTNAISQYEALRSISILGVDFVVILVLGGVLIFFVLLVGFVSFIRAYLRDDLKGRIGTCVYIIDTSGLLLGMLLLFCAVPWFQVIEDVLKPPLRVGLPLGLSFGVGYVISALLLAPTSLSRQRIASWFERAAPRMYVAQRPFESSRDWRKRCFRDIKFGLLVVCCAYGAMVIELIRAYGFKGAAVGHTAILTALVALDCFLISYRSLRAMRSLT